jgi:hypothetical protein
MCGNPSLSAIGWIFRPRTSSFRIGAVLRELGNIQSPSPAFRSRLSANKRSTSASVN